MGALWSHSVLLSSYKLHGNPLSDSLRVRLFGVHKSNLRLLLAQRPSAGGILISKPWKMRQCYNSGPGFKLKPLKFQVHYSLKPSKYRDKGRASSLDKPGISVCVLHACFSFIQRQRLGAWDYQVRPAPIAPPQPWMAVQPVSTVTQCVAEHKPGLLSYQMSRLLGNNKPILRKIKFVGMLLVSITKLKAKFIAPHASTPGARGLFVCIGCGFWWCTNQGPGPQASPELSQAAASERPGHSQAGAAKGRPAGWRGRGRGALAKRGPALQ